MIERNKQQQRGRPSKAQRIRKWVAIVLVVLVLVFAVLWRMAPPRARQHFVRSVAAKVGKMAGNPNGTQTGPAGSSSLAETLLGGKQVAEALGKKAKGVGEAGTNIILVVVDTERADYLGAYGEPMATSPFIDALAQKGVLFTRMFSSAPWTVPAMNSLITGLYPSEHGVVSGGVLVTGGKRRVAGQPPLAEEAVTLADVLQENGYSTFGINTNYHLNAQYGFNQGFDRFVGDDFLFLPYPNMMVSALSSEIENAAKHFVWVHYFDPHFPYRPVPRWFSEWNTTGYRSWADFSRDLVVDYFRKDQKMDKDDPIAPEYMNFLYKVLAPVSGSQAAINYALEYLGTKEDSDYVSFIKATYKSEIRYVDDAIEEAFAKMGVDDESLVVFTSDHGEEMFDHGGFGHRHTLYQELLHVPLIIRLPGNKHAGKVIDAPVSIVDIMPTILDLVGLPIPGGLSGTSLAPLLEGGRIETRPLYAEVKNRFGEGKTLIEYPWKLICNLDTKKTELFNLQNDPGEKNDLSNVELQRAEEMKKRLMEWTGKKRRVFSETTAKPLSPEEIQRLKQMGYLE